MLGIYKQSSLSDNPPIYLIIHSPSACLYECLRFLCIRERQTKKIDRVVKKYKLFLLFAILIQPIKHIITGKGKIMIFRVSSC